MSLELGFAQIFLLSALGPINTWGIQPLVASPVPLIAQSVPTPSQQADELTRRSLQLYEAGQYLEAIPLAEEALVLQREALGDRHPIVATNLVNLATLYRYQGRYSEAERLYLEALDTFAATRPAGDEERLVAEQFLALLYADQGRYEEALSLMVEGLVWWRQLLAADHPELAIVLGNLASIYQDQGRYGEAEPLLQEAVAILRTSPEARPVSLAKVLTSLGRLYRDEGHFALAESAYQEAMTLFRTVREEQHPDLIPILNNLALLYQDQGRYSEAEGLLRDAQAITRRYWGDLHPSTITSTSNLALLYQAQGRYEAAESLLLEALLLRQELMGDRHPDVALSLGNVASLYLAQGRYSEAEPLFQRAISIRRDRLGDRHPALANSLNNLALLYYSQGRYTEAEAQAQAAFTIRQSTLGDTHPDTVDSLNNLAGIYYSQGRYDEAAEILETVVSLQRSRWGAEHPSVALGLNNLALAYLVQGRDGEAELAALEALAIRHRALGTDHPDVASALNSLASVYYVQGRYGAVEPLLLESLAIRRARLGENHPLVADSLNNLASLYEIQGRLTAAMETRQAGLAVEENNLALNLATLSDAQRRDYAATIRDTSDRTLSLHLRVAPDDPAAAHLALTTLLRRKGRILDAGLESLAILRPRLSPADQDRLDDLNATRQQLAAVMFAADGGLSPEQRQQAIADLTTRANDLEVQLARRSALFRTTTQPVEIAAVQAQLPDDSVLVEYGRYRPRVSNDALHPWGAPRYAAYLLFPDGQIVAVDLGAAEPIEAVAQALVGSLEDRSQSVQEVGDRARTLDTLILKPLRPYLDGAAHLLVSPDGMLNQIPFEVLRSPTGAYLVEQFAISYLNSGRDLLRWTETIPSTTPAVILAAPNYGPIPATAPVSALEPPLFSSQRSVDLASLTVSPLEFAFREGRALSRLLPDATFLTGRAATETALKQVQAPQLLHIATHGIFLADAPRQIRVEADTRDRYEIPSEDPLLRSMLALEGFNLRRSGEEDGVLTALESASLNLYGTQLVVLSACETGQGEVVNGEGVYGLRRAFAIAGAESLLMSFWKVEDEGTQDLMVRYYENLLSGMGRSEALRQVQLEMIDSEDYSHPYYWAAFVLTGDWRPLEQED
jgi:CHAT domain-containing protein/Flp pilus assembly protein TadD